MDLGGDNLPFIPRIPAVQLVYGQVHVADWRRRGGFGPLRPDFLVDCVNNPISKRAPTLRGNFLKSLFLSWGPALTRPSGYLKTSGNTQPVR